MNFQDLLGKHNLELGYYPLELEYRQLGMGWSRQFEMEKLMIHQLEQLQMDSLKGLQKLDYNLDFEDKTHYLNWMDLKDYVLFQPKQSYKMGC